MIIIGVDYHPSFQQIAWMDTASAFERACCPIMISSPPRMVIQQSMARNPSLYHAPDSIRWAIHSNFFITPSAVEPPRSEPPPAADS